jgi:hypothetical protein
MSTTTVEPTVNVSIRCLACKKTQVVALTPGELTRIENRRETGEMIQDIIPHLPPNTRELFVSQICDSCFKF